MKKVLVLTVVLVAFAFPLAAKTNLINFDYGIHGKYWGVEDYSLRSIGVDFINLRGDGAGLYSQINPYYALSEKYQGTVYKHSDYGVLSAGINMIFGYGGDINFGSTGLLLGGGLYGDFNYYSYVGEVFSLTGGLGLGANFYYQPGTGSFLVNAGITLAWTPWTYRFNDTDSISESNYGMTYINFNIGIGWRTGGIGSKTAKSSSSGSGGGSDDW
jgi:hypothetical protein